MITKKSIELAVLGATGIVGQRVLALLENDDRFVVRDIVASPARVGEYYSFNSHYANLRFKTIDEISSQYVLSCIPADVAADYEPRLLERGKIIFSNASTHRMQANVPILLPEINLKHLELLKEQKTPGKLVTNPNCVVAFLVSALRPLMDLGEIDNLSVVTLQSLSGGGQKALQSQELRENIVPYIDQEEKKIIRETAKILGTLETPAKIPMMVNVNRVPVPYGHMIVIHIHFDRNISPLEIVGQYEAWNEVHRGLFTLHKEVDRPQPKLDLPSNDNTVHIGGIKQAAPNQVALTLLGHNLNRGAAAATIANLRAYLDSTVV